MEKSTMKAILKENICQIVFIKKDGTERTMRATLNAKLIPQTEDDPKKTPKKKVANDEIIRCYDVEKSDWRCFRIDSVKSFKID